MFSGARFSCLLQCYFPFECVCGKASAARTFLSKCATTQKTPVLRQSRNCFRQKRRKSACFAPKISLKKSQKNAILLIRGSKCDCFLLAPRQKMSAPVGGQNAPVWRECASSGNTSGTTTPSRRNLGKFPKNSLYREIQFSEFLEKVFKKACVYSVSHKHSSEVDYYILVLLYNTTTRWWWLVFDSLIFILIALVSIVYRVIDS